MNTYKLTVSYIGTAYNGWQIQKGPVKTIQGEIQSAFNAITGNNIVKTLASGRTDAGVHALGQVFRAQGNLNIPLNRLPFALNAHLPGDIKILNAHKIDASFHPIRDSIWKEYHYVFSNLKTPNIFANKLMANISYDLDLNEMQKATSIFKGKHDFQNFYCQGSEILTTVREIYDCQLISMTMENSPFEEKYPYYILKIKGSGFLKQMVRLIVGAIWEVGRGKIKLDQLQSYLDGKESGRAGPVALARGLYLKEVFYP